MRSRMLLPVMVALCLLAACSPLNAESRPAETVPAESTRGNECAPGELYSNSTGTPVPCTCPDGSSFEIVEWEQRPCENCRNWVRCRAERRLPALGVTFVFNEVLRGAQ